MSWTSISFSVETCKHSTREVTCDPRVHKSWRKLKTLQDCREAPVQSLKPWNFKSFSLFWQHFAHRLENWIIFGPQDQEFCCSGLKASISGVTFPAFLVKMLHISSHFLERVVIRTSLVLSAKILALRLGGTKEVVRTKAFTPWHAVWKSEATQAPREEMPQTSDPSF